MSQKSIKAQYTAEIKIQAVQQFLNGDKTTRELSSELKVDQDTINNWIKKYKAQGESGFIRTKEDLPKEYNKEIQELKAQIKAKDLEIEILKKFQAFLKEKK